MHSDMNKEYYTNALERSKAEEKELKAKFEKISFLRLFIVISAILTAALLKTMWLLPVFIVAFIYCVNLHIKNEKSEALCRAKQKVICSYISRYDGTWKEREEDGAEFFDDSFHQGRDLDISGKASLYKLICSAYTFKGKKKLADILQRGCKSVEEIYENQSAVKELFENRVFSENFEYRLAMTDNRKRKDTGVFLDCKNLKKSSTFINMLSFILPVVTILSAIMFFFDIYPQITAISALVSAAVSFVLCCIINSVNGGLLRELEMIKNRIYSYYEVINEIEKENFKSEKLKNIKENLKADNVSLQIKNLVKIADRAEIRSNFFASFFLNTIFMWDIHCMRNFEKWAEKNGDKTDTWLDHVAEFEMLISLCVVQIISECTYPEITVSKTPFIEFENLRHTLISPETVKGNSSKFTSSSVIVTGSNMSGKTTFIRSIGLALILANAGAPVTADSFSASFMSVMTSIKTEDSVSEGISTFYAELVRVKHMVEVSSENRLFLMLIDEIFKGTNSKDRIVCAIETIKRLSRENTIVMVTTHDFELCSTDFGVSKTINLHFSEYYEDDKIKFDYKLKEGRCHTTNAQALLKMVGIV